MLSQEFFFSRMWFLPVDITVKGAVIKHAFLIFKKVNSEFWSQTSWEALMPLWWHLLASKTYLYCQKTELDGLMWSLICFLASFITQGRASIKIQIGLYMSDCWRYVIYVVFLPFFIVSCTESGSNHSNKDISTSS